MRVPRIAFAGVGFMGQVAHLRNYAHRAEAFADAVRVLPGVRGA